MNLAGIKGLVRQRVPQENRVSYYVDNEAVVEEVTALIHDKFNCSCCLLRMGNI